MVIAILNLLSLNKKISDKKIISDSFNQHFATIAEKITDTIPPSEVNFKSFLPTPTEKKFTLPSISSNTIIDVLKWLENKNSKDHLGLSVSFLKKFAHEIALPLAHIYNLTFSTGIIPKQFKLSRTVPVFKSGDSEDMNNYRPIGLICVFSKIMEKIVCNHLSTYLESNDLLYSHQFGFRKKHSTVHPMIHFLNEVASATNNNEYLLTIFCDLQKCFDVLNRLILYEKLQNVGIRDVALDWFKNYFDGRINYTDIDGELSDPVLTNLGVIQGSILGPVLSSIYLNDMPSICEKSKLLLFADDSSLMLSHSNLSSLIEYANVEFQKLCVWMRANRLKLHPKKTKFMIFCNKKKSIPPLIPNIFYKDNDNLNSASSIYPIECLNKSTDPSFRFLGLTLDPHLTFKEHVRKITSKVSQGIYILRRVQNLLPDLHLRMLYFSLINSHLYYALPVYGCASASILKPIILLQKKAIRIISRSAYRAHTEPLFKQHKILKFDDMILFSQLDFMHSLSNCTLPKSFNNIWRLKTTLNLRNMMDYEVPLARLEFSKRLPLHKFPAVWNNFNGCDELKFERNKYQFRYKLKRYLFDQLSDQIVCNNNFCGQCNFRHLLI